MPLNNDYINASDPIVDGRSEIFSRAWFRFFSGVATKTKILVGVFSASATAGTAGAPPAQVAGYMTIMDDQGVSRKVPYYNE